MAWDSSLYQRRILHYQNDAVTLKQVLSEKDGADRVTDAWFEKLRIGGDGAGAITLRDSFEDRNDVQIGDFIAFEFRAGERWYFGRVENVDHSSPKGAQINLVGLWAELGEVYPGAFHGTGLGKPHRFSKEDYFSADPDHTFQTVDTVSQPESVVKLLFDRYVAAATHITIGSIESPSPLSGFESMVVRGEESVAELYRRLAAIGRFMSVGVTSEATLYFLRQRINTLVTYQEGVDVQNLIQTQDRSLLFNRILLTGGYVYGATGKPGFYRSRWNFVHGPSAAIHGERAIEIFVPEIRRNHDALMFTHFFFAQYAQATLRYSFRVEYDGAFPFPYLGWVRLLDKDGNLLANGQFDTIRVEFNHKPIFDIVIGPEDIQFPNAPENQRWELPNPDDRGDGEDPPDHSLFSQTTFDESSALSSARVSSDLSASKASSDLSSARISSDLSASAASSDLSSARLSSSAFSSQQASSAASSAAISSALSSARASSALSSDALASSALSSDALASSALSSQRASSARSSDALASSAQSSRDKSSAQSSDALASSAKSSKDKSDAADSSAKSSADKSSADSSAAKSSRDSLLRSSSRSSSCAQTSTCPLVGALL